MGKVSAQSLAIVNMLIATVTGPEILSYEKQLKELRTFSLGK